MNVLAIDGNSLLNRAYYGIPHLTNKEGKPTNAIYGFLRILEKIEKEQSFDCVIVAFDLKAPTFRHKLYEKYKESRKGMPDQLAEQLLPTKQILSDMGFHILEQEGYEADDLLGTIAKCCAKQKHTCVIATGDRDSFQLIDAYTVVRYSTTREVIYYNEEKIWETYGILPKQFIEIKGLMGDRSDDIPGIKGIGEKTAFALIQKYGNIENIFENIEKLETTARVKKLLSAEDAYAQAKLSKKLGKIFTDAPIASDIKSYLRHTPNVENLCRRFKSLDFTYFLERWETNTEKKEETQTLSAGYRLHNPNLEEVKKLLEKEDAFALLLKNEKLQMMIKDHYIEYTKDYIEAVFKDLILPSNLQKNTHHAKDIYHYCLHLGVPMPKKLFDAEIAAYLLDVRAKSYEPEKLFENYNIKIDKASENEDVIGLTPLCRLLENQLQSENLAQLFYEVEAPLCEVLAVMEKEGILIDKENLQAFGKQLYQNLMQTQEEIYHCAGEQFNINSTQELGKILYEKLLIPAPRKNKKGHYSTAVEVLEKRTNMHPIIGMILEYRKYSKLYSTYVQGMLKLIHPKSGRLHSVFKQTETKTGRISSVEPNLQNIPIRTPLGMKMRNFFIAKKDAVLIDADYSQIELRVLAHMSGDAAMIRSFKENVDIHTRTAALIFGVPEEKVPSTLRYRAKAINFGILYGMTPFRLGKDLNISTSEAKAYMDQYFRMYQGVHRFLQQTIEEAKHSGQVHTLFGRVRLLPELSSSSATMRAFGERIASNTPIQGTAADIIKIAMVKVYRRLKEEQADAKPVLQVHDELILEASYKDAEKAKEILKYEMEHAVKLKVPLEVDMGMGKDWGSIHS